MREIAVQQSASRQIAPNELADALPPLPAQQANASRSLQHPPSWADASCPPPAGAWCSCCKGGQLVDRGRRAEGLAVCAVPSTGPSWRRDVREVGRGLRMPRVLPDPPPAVRVEDDAIHSVTNPLGKLTAGIHV